MGQPCYTNMMKIKAHFTFINNLYIGEQFRQANRQAGRQVEWHSLCGLIGVSGVTVGGWVEWSDSGWGGWVGWVEWQWVGGLSGVTVGGVGGLSGVTVGGWVGWVEWQWVGGWLEWSDSGWVGERASERVSEWVLHPFDESHTKIWSYNEGSNNTSMYMPELPDILKKFCGTYYKKS